MPPRPSTRSAMTGRGGMGWAAPVQSQPPTAPMPPFVHLCEGMPRVSEAMAAFVEIDNVSKSFDGGRTFAVDRVTLQIEASAFVALVGTSGSGKTTTLKFINRLVEPDQGEVRLDGAPVAAVAA